MTNEDKNNRHINIWKYLFIGLILMISLGIITMFIISGDSGDINDQHYVREHNDIEVHIEVDRKDIETIANVFIKKETGNASIDYYLTLNDNPQIKGESSYMGIPFDFTVNLAPVTLDNGNLRLDIESITLSGYELPEQLVLTILSNQIQLPDFVVFNPSDSYIGINLNEFQLENGGQITVDQFNIESNDVRATIHLPVSAIESIG